MMWKKRGNDLYQSNGFVMLPLSNVVGFEKTFFVTHHEQVTLITGFLVLVYFSKSELCTWSISERSKKKVIKLNCL